MTTCYASEVVDALIELWPSKRFEDEDWSVDLDVKYDLDASIRRLRKRDSYIRWRCEKMEIPVIGD